jgi:hypothetical protein
MDETMKRKLEDALDASDRARTKIEIAALQLAAAGLKDSEAVAKLRTASTQLREARQAMLALRTA